MNDFRELLERLRRVEALHARTDVAGEKQAAAAAMDAIRQRLERMQSLDPPVEYKFTMANEYNRRLLVALFRRYGIEPFRYHGQRYTTVMARVPKRFVDETLWPEYLEISQMLESYLSDITSRVIREAIWEDASEAAVCEAPKGITYSRSE
jgi:hypothetical protein